MKTILKCAVMITAVAALSGCQNLAPHAAVHRGDALQATRSMSAQVAGSASYVRSECRGELTGYKLPGERGELPAAHEEFTLLPTYPQTHSVWVNPALMQQDGHRQVRILLGPQRGLYLVNGQVAMDFPVCTGRGNKRTPTGSFCILQKHADHHSNLYDCPMPYFMRLTWSGVGLHVGDVYRSPASHGCIRLPQVACEPLYHALPCGSRVVVSE